ncbi:reverse transcriptase [Gossypium australe]|uniref:Reverse transcriptase n=1 Tax=Gossypium australe TaxID=47621 RepID=A0A5B6VZU8_9ROSI|nr:reverse transcriptase [Gossypium australe]
MDSGIHAHLELLQPLPLPSRAWSKITMNFIEGLPSSKGKYTILVVVDHLTKYGHFLALAHPYTTASVATTLLDNVYKLHGLLDAIISNRDRVFTSSFWQECFEGWEPKSNCRMPTAYHPESDSQSEVLNRCLEGYLQWWYNSTFHFAVQTTPYEALYNQPPPQHLPYLVGSSKVDNVDHSLQHREAVRQLLKYHLQRTQDRIKHYADKKRRDRSFSIHPTFHVSQLKCHVGSKPSASTLPLTGPKEMLLKELARILDKRIYKRGHHAVTEVLVEWANYFPDDETWEVFSDFQQLNPSFDP